MDTDQPFSDPTQQRILRIVIGLIIFGVLLRVFDNPILGAIIGAAIAFGSNNKAKRIKKAHQDITNELRTDTERVRIEDPLNPTDPLGEEREKQRQIKAIKLLIVGILLSLGVYLYLNRDWILPWIERSLD
ncbi:hypothetical protein GF380_04410 [Candidatus Uhrbacteria bacterium]|nr:hypothetical protein [Candidatus Uhrbacteria bacterium]MBD3284303.1 hypothetical protein [Candidatus Uhrbacteria bacterium]